MSNSYTIKTTDGSKSITILAGSFNGNSIGSAGQDTDLLLYGRGSFNWGQGIEQNLIRMTESWASEAENPTAAVNAQIPKDFGATPNTGINKPLQGQLWFNKSNNRLYINIDGNNTSGSWRVDAENRFLSTDGGTISNDLRISTASPDLYLHATATGFQNNAHLVFESNNADDVRVRTATVVSTNSGDAIAQALHLRKYNQLDENDIQNEIAIRSTFTSISQPIRMFPDMDVNAPDDTLVRKDYVDSQVVGFVSATGDTMTGDLVISKGTPRINLIATTDTGQPQINFLDSDGADGALKSSIRMLQGSVTSDLLDSTRTLMPNADTLLIEKYGGSAPATNNGMAFFDTHIETHQTNGKIRTPLTLLSDDDQTLVTLKTVKDEFRSNSGNLNVIHGDSIVLTSPTNPNGGIIRFDNIDNTLSIQNVVDFDNGTSAVNSSIEMHDDHVSITNPRADSSVDTDDDPFTLATKGYSDETNRAVFGISFASQPYLLTRATNTTSQWTRATNILDFESTDGIAELPLYDITFSGNRKRRKNLEDTADAQNLTATMKVSITFNYYLQVDQALALPQGSYGIMPVNVEYRELMVGADPTQLGSFTPPANVGGLPPVVITSPVTGQNIAGTYSVETVIQGVSADTDTLRISIGSNIAIVNGIGTNQFGPMGNSGEFLEQFDAVMISHVSIKVMG